MLMCPLIINLGGGKKRYLAQKHHPFTFFFKFLHIFYSCQAQIFSLQHNWITSSISLTKNQLELDELDTSQKLV